MHGRLNEGALTLARQLTGILWRREQAFGRGIVNEIQWEMLLRLLTEDGDSGSLCERSLLVGGGTSTVDAQRQLAQLIEAGLVWRVDGEDGDEPCHIHLTGATRSRMLRVLGGIGAFADEVRSGFLAESARQKL